MFIDLVRELSSNEKDAGNETRFNCPFCLEEKQKLYIQAEEPYLWHCKHCDRHGNPVQFVMQFYDVRFQEAKEILESYDYYLDDTDRNKVNEAIGGSGTKLTDAEKLFLLIRASKNQEENNKQPLIPVDIPKSTKFLKDNTTNPESYPFFNYLIGRNISPYKAINYNIGYIVEDSIKSPNTGNDIPIRNSLLFPTYNSYGEVIYWNTRSIEPNPYIKAINAPEISGHYSKSTAIFNLNNARLTDKIVVTEGVLNAMSVASGVATFGKQVTDEQVRLLSEVAVDKHIPIYIFLDYDAKAQSINLAKRLYNFTKDVYIVINPYPNKDANDLGIEIANRLVEKAIKYSPDSLAELVLTLS